MQKYFLVLVLVLLLAFSVYGEGPLIVDGQNGDLFIPATANIKWTSTPMDGMKCYKRSTPNNYICVDKSVVVRNGDMKIVLPPKKVNKAKKQPANQETK